MSNAEFLFIRFIIISSQFHPLLTLNQIAPETCYEVTLNATSSYHAENKQPTKVNIDKVKQLLSKPHDIHEFPACSNVTIELKNEPYFRSIPTRNITQLSLTFLIEPTNKMEKLEAYFCAENALQRATANETRLKDLLVFSEETKPNLWLRIDQKSCCEEQEHHFKACCRKGYALKNKTCQEEADEIVEEEVEKCEAVKMEKEKCSPSLSLGIIIILAATCLVVMVVIILAGIRVWKIRHRPREPEEDVERPAVDTNIVETLEPNTEAVPRNDSTVPEYMKMDSFSTTRTQSTTASSRASSMNDTDKRPMSRSEMMFDFKKHIPKTAIIFTGTVLGSGQFGRVELANVTIGGTTKKCAVKMIRGRGTNEDEKELFHELELLYQIPNHPNVVSLLAGCVDADSPLYVVVEYCAKGNLLHYLKKKKRCDDYVNLTTSPLSFRWKMKRAIEICEGMIFLSNNQIIHRDLAARNILLDENEVAKISDFGMAKDVYLRGLYVKETAGFLPIRWMAIEAIESSIYTIKSDMWSFGILLWELYMDGQLPYPAISDANKLLDRLKEEYRMPKPENCPDSLHQLMGRCWLRKPDERPAFLQTLRKLKVIKHAETKRESATSEEADSSDEQPVFEEQQEPREAYGDKIFTNNTNAVGLDNYGHSRNSDIELDEMTNTKEETTTL